MSIESVMPSNHLILCHPLLLLSVFPSIIVFSSEFFALGGQSIGVSAQHSPSNEYSGLISFRMDQLDLLSVQGTLKSLLQHHNSKASILQCSAFTVQLSHPYMTTGKTIALTRWTFMANRWGNKGNSNRLFPSAPKSGQMVTATMKLKDAYSLEGKL